MTKSWNFTYKIGSNQLLGNGRRGEDLVTNLLFCFRRSVKILNKSFGVDVGTSVVDGQEFRGVRSAEHRATYGYLRNQERMARGDHVLP
jgi:hypothetical protein